MEKFCVSVYLTRRVESEENWCRKKHKTFFGNDKIFRIIAKDRKKSLYNILIKEFVRSLWFRSFTSTRITFSSLLNYIFPSLVLFPLWNCLLMWSFFLFLLKPGKLKHNFRKKEKWRRKEEGFSRWKIKNIKNEEFIRIFSSFSFFLFFVWSEWCTFWREQEKVSLFWPKIPNLIRYSKLIMWKFFSSNFFSLQSFQGFKILIDFWNHFVLHFEIEIFQLFHLFLQRLSNFLYFILRFSIFPNIFARIPKLFRFYLDF